MKNEITSSRKVIKNIAPELIRRDVFLKNTV